MNTTVTTFNYIKGNPKGSSGMVVVGSEQGPSICGTKRRVDTTRLNGEGATLNVDYKAIIKGEFNVWHCVHREFYLVVRVKKNKKLIKRNQKTKFLRRHVEEDFYYHPTGFNHLSYGDDHVLHEFDIETWFVDFDTNSLYRSKNILPKYVNLCTSNFSPGLDNSLIFLLEHGYLEFFQNTGTLKREVVGSYLNFVMNGRLPYARVNQILYSKTIEYKVDNTVILRNSLRNISSIYDSSSCLKRLSNCLHKPLNKQHFTSLRNQYKKFRTIEMDAQSFDVIKILLKTFVDGISPMFEWLYSNFSSAGKWVYDKIESCWESVCLQFVSMMPVMAQLASKAASTIKQLFDFVNNHPWFVKIVLCVACITIVGVSSYVCYKSLWMCSKLISTLTGVNFYAPQVDEEFVAQSFLGSLTGVSWIISTITGSTNKDSVGILRGLSSYNSSKSLFQDLSDFVPDILDSIWFFTTGSDLSLKGMAKREFSVLEKEFDEKLEGKVFENEAKMKEEFCVWFCSWKHRFNVSYKKYSTTATNVIMLSAAKKKKEFYDDLLRTVNRVRPISRTRLEPITILLMSSQAGVGKTVLAELFVMALFEIACDLEPDKYKRPFSKSCIFQKPFSSDYWDGYITGETFAVLIDEFMNTRNIDDRCKMARDFISVADKISYCVDMSAVEDKGETYVNHRINVVTTPLSASEFCYQNGLAQQGALERRIDLIIEPIPIPGGMIDDKDFNPDLCWKLKVHSLLNGLPTKRYGPNKLPMLPDGDYRFSSLIKSVVPQMKKVLQLNDYSVCLEKIRYTKCFESQVKWSYYHPRNWPYYFSSNTGIESFFTNTFAKCMASIGSPKFCYDSCAHANSSCVSPYTLYIMLNYDIENEKLFGKDCQFYGQTYIDRVEIKSHIASFVKPKTFLQAGLLLKYLDSDLYFVFIEFLMKFKARFTQETTLVHACMLWWYHCSSNYPCSDRTVSILYGDVFITFAEWSMIFIVERGGVPSIYYLLDNIDIVAQSVIFDEIVNSSICNENLCRRLLHEKLKELDSIINEFINPMFEYLSDEYSDIYLFGFLNVLENYTYWDNQGFDWRSQYFSNINETCEFERSLDSYSSEVHYINTLRGDGGDQVYRDYLSSIDFSSFSPVLMTVGVIGVLGCVGAAAWTIWDSFREKKDDKPTLVSAGMKAKGYGGNISFENKDSHGFVNYDGKWDPQHILNIRNSISNNPEEFLRSFVNTKFPIDSSDPVIDISFYHNSSLLGKVVLSSVVYFDPKGIPIQKIYSRDQLNKFDSHVGGSFSQNFKNDRENLLSSPEKNMTSFQEHRLSSPENNMTKFQEHRLFGDPGVAIMNAQNGSEQKTIRARKVQDNIFMCTLWCGDKTSCTYAFCVGFRTFVVTSHAVTYLKTVDKFELHFSDSGKSQIILPHHMTFKQLENRDLMRIDVSEKAIMANKSLIDRLPSRGSVSNFHYVIRLSREVTGDGKVFYDSHVFDNGTSYKWGKADNVLIDIEGKRSVTHFNEWYIVKGGAGVKGDCGHIYVSYDREEKSRDILGMHVASQDTSGIFCPLYREDFMDLKGQVISLTESTEVLDAQLDIFPGVRISGLGIKPPVIVGTKTSFVKSVIYNDLNKILPTISEFDEIPVAPAMLHKFENDGVIIDPQKLSFLKLHEKSQSKSVSDRISRMSDDPRIWGDFMKNIGILKFREWETVLFTFDLPGFDPSKSPTYDFGKYHLKRSDLWGSANSPNPSWILHGTPMSDGNRWINPLIVEVCSEVRNNVFSGTIYINEVSAAWKDELRDLERVRKGKTRLFCVSSLVIAIVVKSFLGDLIAQKGYRYEIPSKVGTNAYSQDWKFMFSVLNRHPNLMGGDFGGWDYSILALFCYMFYKWLMTLPFECSSEHKENVCRFISQSCVGFFLLYSKFVLRRDKGVSSGNWLTSFFNTFCNFCLHKIFFYHQMPSDKFYSWKDVVDLVLYGDDNGCCVSNSIKSWFNMIEMEKFCREQFNMNYTTPDKNEVSGPFLDWTTFQFLSRKFTLHPEDHNIVLSPLSMDSIVGMLAYVRKPPQESEVTLISQLAQNIHTAETELYMHGEEKFNRWHRWFITLNAVYKLNASLRDYHYIDDQFRRQYHF